MSLVNPWCCRCGTRDSSQFRWHPSRNGYASHCNACDSTRGNENKERRRQWLNAAKDDLAKDGCVVCGETDRDVIEFHHVVPRDGKYQPADMVRNLQSWIEDIARTCPLCANCHLRWHKGKLTQLIMPLGVSAVKDAVSRHRPTSRRVYKRGADHPNASLTREQAATIRHAHAQGAASYNELARQYGVSKNTVVKAVKDYT